LVCQNICAQDFYDTNKLRRFCGVKFIMFNNAEYRMRQMHTQAQAQHMLHVAPAMTAQSVGQQHAPQSVQVQLSQQQQWNTQVFQNALQASAFWRRFRSVKTCYYIWCFVACICLYK
jgi:hypothetical protein